MIIEVLREYWYLLLSHKVIIHTDHKNLTYDKCQTKRHARWRWFVEEFAPKLRYIKGKHNIVADALSHLDLLDPDSEAVLECYITDKDMAEMYCLNMPQHSYSDKGFPLSYSNILKHQSKDNQLKQDVLKKKGFSERLFHGGGKSYSLICYKDKICVPSTLQKCTVPWYHTYLCHPGKAPIKETIRQHLWCVHIYIYIYIYIYSYSK